MQSNISKSIYKYATISPKKVMPVLDVVRKMDVGKAVSFLTFDPTKASKMVLKTLNSAVANAKQSGAQEDGLYIEKITADTAPTSKRASYGSRSHFSRILKRQSHITVVLGNKKEGK